MTSRASRVLFLASSAIIAVTPVRAQDGDGRLGLAFAQEACASCHAVRKGGRSPNSGAPAFEVIAAVPGMTALALQSILQTSHREMPNLILIANERANVIAYILSLNSK